MSQLSAQSIRKCCLISPQRVASYGIEPMISPFLPDARVINGKSAGLSAASYDIRIGEDLVLGPDIGQIAARALLDAFEDTNPADSLTHVRRRLRAARSPRAITFSLEKFCIPNDVAGYVCDKSTYARLHVSLFNTLFDPGFRGFATLEVVNLGDQEVVIQAGDPICQLVFHWLDEPTDRPYKGKYQDQPQRAVQARHQHSDGTYLEATDLIA